MMKIFTKQCLSLFVSCICTLTILNAQVGVGTTAPHPSAMLDVSSTKLGFLPPRVTGQQRDSIVNPAGGLLVWCSNCGNGGELNVFDGDAWVTMAGAAADTGAAFVIGGQFLGGTLAYIYQPGDSEYVAGQVHGIVASFADIGYTVGEGAGTATPYLWQPAQIKQGIATGATDTAIGMGAANTKLIVNAMGAGTYAALACETYATGANGNWHLPSENELLKLYKNRSKINGFNGQRQISGGWTGTPTGFYWSSTAIEAGNMLQAVMVSIGDGSLKSSPRNSNALVRPVKCF